MKNLNSFLLVIILFLLFLIYCNGFNIYEQFSNINSRVIHGSKTSSNLYDYPTANIANNINLPCGIYTAESNFGDCICMVLSPFNIECHIKKFNKNIYGKELKLRNIKKIKGEQGDISYLIEKSCKE